MHIFFIHFFFIPPCCLKQLNSVLETFLYPLTLFTWDSSSQFFSAQNHWCFMNLLYHLHHGLVMISGFTSLWVTHDTFTEFSLKSDYSLHLLGCEIRFISLFSLLLFYISCFYYTWFTLLALHFLLFTLHTYSICLCQQLSQCFFLSAAR